MSDLISRQAAIDAIGHTEWLIPDARLALRDKMRALPSAEPEIIRCKDCKWWDKYNDSVGFCMAEKHWCLSEYMDISIRQTCREDFYCADAERREEDDE